MQRISLQTLQLELLLEVLPQHAIPEIRDILMVPLSMTSYDVVKNGPMNRLVESEERHIEQLLSYAAVRRPQTHQVPPSSTGALRGKAASPDTAILQELLLQISPTFVRMGLATADTKTLPQLAELAGTLLQASAQTVSATRGDV